jgi:hypothetical protein
MWDSWMLSMEVGAPIHQPMSVDSAMIVVAADSLYGPPSQRELLLKYRPHILELLPGFKLCGQSVGTFLHDLSHRPPVVFAQMDNRTCLIVADFTSDTIFNTLKLSTKQRAARVIEDCVLPKLGDFERALGDTDIAFYGVTVIYGSKDFSDESSVLNRQPEMVALVVPRDVCAAYVKGDITDGDLLQKSHVYLSDRESVYSVRKVDLVLQ